MEQIAGGQLVGQTATGPAGDESAAAAPSSQAPSAAVPGVPGSAAGPDANAAKFQKSLLDGDLEFVSGNQLLAHGDIYQRFHFQLKYLSYDELLHRMANLDQDMELEIDDLRRRYHAKRQPILDAMDQKRKRQQNF